MNKKLLSQIALASGLGFAAITQVQAVEYVFTDLGTLGGASSSAYGINSSGQVVGWSDTGKNDVARGNVRATLWNVTTASDLGALVEWAPSIAYSINDLGQVVGQSYTGNGGSQHATLWNGAAMTDLTAAH